MPNLIGARQYITIATGILYELLKQWGIVGFDSKMLETTLTVLYLIFLGLLRYYRGRKLFTRKPQPVTDGGIK
jgi:hypothetical protein